MNITLHENNRHTWTLVIDNAGKAHIEMDNRGRYPTTAFPDLWRDFVRGLNSDDTKGMNDAQRSTFKAVYTYWHDAVESRRRIYQYH
jgi:hypothetical protein